MNKKLKELLKKNKSSVYTDPFKYLEESEFWILLSENKIPFLQRQAILQFKNASTVSEKLNALKLINEVF